MPAQPPLIEKQRLFPREPDPRTYEPAPSLAAAFSALERAISYCEATQSFSSTVAVCRKCRTAFAEFTGQLVSGTQGENEANLVVMEKLMPRCHEVVHATLPHLTEPEEQRLAEGYLDHIQDRIRLIQALREGGLRRFLIEMRKLLAAVPTPAMAGVA